jgi:hypothetical protein
VVVVVTRKWTDRQTVRKACPGAAWCLCCDRRDDLNPQQADAGTRARGQEAAVV